MLLSRYYLGFTIVYVLKSELYRKYRAMAILLQFIDEGHWRKFLINNKTQRCPGSEIFEIIGLKSLYAF